MTHPIRRRAALLAAPALLTLPHLARAQPAWAPSRTVRMIVPYTPGGVSDITARLIAEPLAAAWGQAVPVENRTGADGVIGTDALARLPADGHALGLVSVAHSVNPAFHRLPFDTIRDFTFITQTTATPLALCVPRASPATTPAELVALAKRTPGIPVATTGGVVRLAPQLLAQQTGGFELTDVNYRGSTAAHPDLISGRVAFMFDTVAAILPHIQAGSVRCLATTGARRAPQLPDVPTLAEALLPGFEASTWGMVFAPAGLPPAAVARINADCIAALRRPEIVERHRALGAEVVTSTPEAAKALVESEMEKWVGAARKAGIQPQAG
ncbi:MAG: tripartite tricarboxylate transporter substrate binding protein [Acetobacteraceae bacterium]|nr:tripartite tricarboxylate transporter substrate binding protein [Acetobacteraceae bacterium]